MTGIDRAQTIAQQCPRYPEPDRFNNGPRYRIQTLNTFQEDARNAATWLVEDTLRAALSYIAWLEANVIAADNEFYGICASVNSKGKEPIPFNNFDLSDFTETKEMILKARQILKRVRDQGKEPAGGLSHE